jgi:hypothetical protein
MLDGNSTPIKINVIYSNAQGFTYPAAKAKKQPNEELVPEVFGTILKLFNFFWLKVGFHLITV